MFVAKITVEEFQGEKSLFVVLTYTDPSGLELEFVPENPMEITSIEAEGGCDWTPSNGAFCISWDTDSFRFSGGRFGDGCGGQLVIRVPNTPALMNSFKEELNRWREAASFHHSKW